MFPFVDTNSIILLKESGGSYGEVKRLKTRKVREGILEQGVVTDLEKK